MLGINSSCHSLLLEAMKTEAQSSYLIIDFDLERNGVQQKQEIGTLLSRRMEMK